MKLKKVIEDASLLLGIRQDDVANQRLLFRCANLCLSNVASNHIECLATQVFDVTNGKIGFDQFEKTCLKIKHVSARFNLHTGYISVPNGRVVVTYAYSPEFKSKNDDVSIVGGVMNPTALLYGIITEYAIICELKDEVDVFGKRFARALFGIQDNPRKGKSRRIPA